MTFTPYEITLLVILAAVWMTPFLCALGVVAIIMRPFILQRRRQIQCHHEWKEFKYQPNGGPAYTVFFCPKCTAHKTIAIDNQVDRDIGLVTKPKPKAPAKRTKPKGVPA